MRASLFLLAFLPAFALAQSTIEREGKLDPRKNQKIERIHIEDSANTIDELRVGGQAENITVKPKSNMPAYEVPASNLARSRPDDRDGLDGRKQRRWNILGF
jgi:hypothetical protein